MKYKLGDIAPVQQGTVPETDKYWLLNLDMVESNTGKIIDYLYVELGEIGTSTIMFDRSNVLYSKLRPYLNKVVLPKAEGYATSEMLPLKPNTEIVTREYLTYFLRSKSFVEYINEKTSGAKMPRANTSDLKAVEIDCPLIEEQRKITELFDRLVAIIDKRKQELEELDNLIKSRFVEMFGDRFVNDKNWCTRKLRECMNFNNGKAHEQVVDENGEYILITSRAIASDLKDVRRTNALLFPLHRNDIVMVMSDVPNGRALAKCLLIEADEKYTLNQRICSFDNYEFNPVFLVNLLNRHQYFLDFNDGNGQTNLRKNDILDCDLIIPPVELQEQFATFVKQVTKLKFEVQKSLDETQILMDSLMQQYFG